LKSALKSLVRPWELPLREKRNQLLGARTANQNRRFQGQEVERLRHTSNARQLEARVLVVIPTYRRHDQLLRAVHSALAQNYEDLVVVVVDDGGGLPSTLPPDPRLRSVSLSRNTATAGLVRNVGIELASSEFICFLDDDNVWTPDHVATAVTALENDPTLDAVYTSVRRISPDGSEKDILCETFDRRKLMVTNYIDTNSIVVRRSAHRGFSVLPRKRNTIPGEDWEYIWQLSGRGRVAHVPHITVNYAVNPDSYFSDWDLK
jgi:glycosyltransferase involved in cell wall biosynthesis